VLVRERTRPPSAAPRPRRRPPAELVAAVRRARGEPYGRLLLARFLYVDAIATVIQFLTVYPRRTGDFDGSRIDLLLAVSTVAALIGAVGAGCWPSAWARCV
jgi:MFS-type transporter involved in bile tolerance (Atg22 family)